MRPSPRLAAALVVVLATLGLAACSDSGSGDGGLADTVRAQTEAQEALRKRVGDIEDKIEAVLSRDDITDFRTMQETLETMQTRLDELGQQLDDAGVSAEDRAATVDATLAQLAEDVQGLTAAVAQLESGLQQLREDQESLEVQFRAHRTDDDRHQ